MTARQKAFARLTGVDLKFRALKRAVVRACWWLFPPLGTTVNEYLGGKDATGLYGGYEKRRPADATRQP